MILMVIGLSVAGLLERKVDQRFHCIFHGIKPGNLFDIDVQYRYIPSVIASVARPVGLLASRFLLFMKLYGRSLR